MDLNRIDSTGPVFGNELLPFFVNFLLYVYLLDFYFDLSCIFLELVSGREAMLVLASVSVVGTAPIPPILVLLDGFQEEFTDDIRSTTLDDFSLLLAYHLPQLLFR